MVTQIRWDMFDRDTAVDLHRIALSMDGENKALKRVQEKINNPTTDRITRYVLETTLDIARESQDTHYPQNYGFDPGYLQHQ